MGEEQDPIQKLVTLLTQGAKGYADAFTAMAEAMGQKLTGEGDGDAQPIQAQAERIAQAWGQAAFELTGVLTELMTRIADGLPDAARERVDRQTFGQLGRLAAERIEQELSRLGDLPAAMAERFAGAGGADTERMGPLLTSMLNEYLQDLQTLSADAFRIDVKPLADAVGKVLSGQADPDSRAMVDRFVSALAVKARYGAEYYADPERTLVGQTPRELVHRQDRIALYRYIAPQGTPQVDAPPVLLVYSVINKPYILDLQPGFSFVEHLLARGLDVYLIDWGEAAPGDRQTTLDDYIDPGIAGCVDRIRERTGCDRVSLFGHCIGGNLALLYAALFPERVDRMITLTTPITAAEGGVVAVWTDRELFPVDQIIETYGHMPAKMIRYTFMALKPYYEIMKWKMFLENLGDERVMGLFMPVDRWANENVDIPGEVFRKFVREVFHDQTFAKGQTEIHGRRADLKNVTCPLLNLAATKDWIVPLPSAQVLNDLVGSKQKLFIPIEGAHVGIMIDPRARTHWDQMADFLSVGAEAPAKKKPAKKKPAKKKPAKKKPAKKKPAKKKPAKKKPSAKR